MFSRSSAHARHAFLVGAIIFSAFLTFIANRFAATFVHVGQIQFAVGTLTFALGYTLDDYIRRYHGRRATIVGIIAGACGTLAFSAVFGGGLGRFVVAGLISLAIASSIDIRVQTRLLGGPIWRLVLLSNAASLLVDTVVFTLLAFWGVQGVAIPNLIVGDYLVKIAMSLISIPLIYGVSMVVPFRPLPVAVAR